MRRLKWLILLGVVLFAAVAVYVLSRGGLSKVIGLEVDIVTDLSDWDSPQRQVRIFGPTLLSERIAEKMQLAHSAGWARASRTDPDGRSYLLFSKTGQDGELPSWRWSKTVLEKDSGLGSVEFVYEEELTAPMAQKIHEVRKDYLERITSQERESLKEEFVRMLREVGRRAQATFEEILLEASVRLIVKMPGEVTESDGPGIMTVKGSLVAFEAKTNEMAPPFKLRVTSTRTNPWGWVIVAVLTLAAAGAVFYWWWQTRRRRELFRKLRSDMARGDAQSGEPS